MALRPLPDTMRGEIGPLLERTQSALLEIALTTDDRPARQPGAEPALAAIRGPLSDSGTGALATLEELLRLNEVAASNSAGPRCFHFVVGGSTPAALAADLLATAFDAMAYTWVLSPPAVELERLALDWLKELFELPAAWSGVIVTGATMANFVGLAAARQWWGEAHGIDPSETGLSGAPPLPVLSSGLVHASTFKALAMLGIGRANLQRFERDEFGRVDLEGMRATLEGLGGQPAVIVVNAGEVNAGEFDPVLELIELAREHRCWVHVDGAFGLFARLSPRTRHLVEGVELADSVTVDGHKWLNVPYDSGYAFVRDHGLMARAFRYAADYLPDEDDPRPTPGALGPDNSRRARSFAVWATLAAYGRAGQREIVEHCLDIASHFARVVEGSADLELIRDPLLNIVPFRYNPGGHSEAELDDLNERLGAAVNDDGRFLVGTTRLGSRTVFRPAFSNWRTRPEDVEEFARVVAALAVGL